MGVTNTEIDGRSRAKLTGGEGRRGFMVAGWHAQGASSAEAAQRRGQTIRT